MLLPRRLRDLNQIASRLRSANAIAQKNNLQGRNFESSEDYQTGSIEKNGLKYKNKFSYSNFTQDTNGERERILFRMVPIQLSLFERAVSKSDAASNSNPPLSATTNVILKNDSKFSDLVTVEKEVSVLNENEKANIHYIKAVDRVLFLLNYFEDERGAFYRERIAASEFKYKKAMKKYDEFNSEFSHLIKASKHRNVQKRDLAIIEEVLETQSFLKNEVDLASEDLRLLQTSILSRPFVSVKMWKFLLNNKVWEPLLLDIRATLDQQGSSGLRGSVLSKQTQLLSLSSLVMRLCLSTLNHYVAGGELNKYSPRFVVSLPSHRYRLRKQEKNEHINQNPQLGKIKSDSTQGTEDELDPLSFMLSENIDELPGTVEPPQQQTERPNSAPSLASSLSSVDTGRKMMKVKLNVKKMKFIPPRSGSTQEVVLDILALQQFVVPLLQTDIFNFTASDKDAYKLFEKTLYYLVSVQKAATTLFILQNDKSPLSNEVLHRILAKLEVNILQSSRLLKRNLITFLTHSGIKNLNASPAEAGRMVLALDSLKLLKIDEEESDVLLYSLTTIMFPQLKTQTQEKLKRPIDQHTSLVQFTTKAHRKKLLQKYGSMANVEKYLAGTIIQQSRLQQRMLRASLRQQYLERVNVAHNESLGASLSKQDIILLLEIVCVRASIGEQAVYAAQNGATNIYVSAALNLAEALMLSCSLENGSEESEASIFTIADLIKLFSSLVLLGSVVEARHNRSKSNNDRRRTHCTLQERSIVRFLHEFVLSSINGLLAEHLMALQKANDNKAGRGKLHETVPDSISLSQLTQIAVVLTEYGRENNASMKNMNHNGEVQKQVDYLFQILREIFIHDSNLKEKVRLLNLEKREELEKSFVNCFSMSDKLDVVVKEAIEKMCFKV